MEAIFSKSNENVKFIKSLNEKKFRNKNKAFYLEGVKIVDEILDKKEAIDIVFIAYSKSTLLATNGGENLLNKINSLKNIKCIEFEENIFKYMTDTVNPQGVLAVLKMPEYNLSEILNGYNKNVVILDKVQDLGNIGTIVRSCNAFDVEVIICTLGTADVYSPKTLRSTMGAILNTKIIYLENVSELEILKEKGYDIVTTSLQGTENLSILSEDKKFAFVMGNEANGVSEEIVKMSDLLVKIPMTDKIESLNVGVATSIILYEQYKKTSR